MTLVTAIINFKGGVTKMTTTINLGTELKKMGERILVIDTESQENTNNFNAIVGTTQK